MSGPEPCPRCQAVEEPPCAACRLGEATTSPAPLEPRSLPDARRLLRAATALIEAPDLEGENVGPYAIGRMLGQGGMGVVYEAVDTRPTSCRFQRTVALKILAGELDAPDQLVREAQLLAALEHKHIVPVYEVGEHEGIVYFTMKRIDGGPLTTPAPSPRRAAEIALEIAEAVALAHRYGILHRDLKPANVLVDREGRTYVTDFGLAARDGLASSYALTPGGTPAYMAPEVWRGEPHAASTMVDVWGAGAILYELLTGRPPFEAPTLAELRERVLTEAPPPLRGVPADLAAVCLRCLEKDPSRRYATGAGLSADLTRFLANQPVVARPLGLGALALRRAAGHPVITALAALFIAAALYAAVTAFALARAEQAALRAADFAARRAAEVTALKFERYTAAVETAGRDPQVARALADPASFEPSEVCARFLGTRDGPTAGPFANWAMYDREGTQIGRAPFIDRRALGRSFKFRDYFRGVEELERQGRRVAHISRVYRSENDGDHRIAISFAVHDAAGRWVGVLAAGLQTGSTLGSIELDDPGDERFTAALIAPRDLSRGEDEIDPEPMFIMHRALNRGETLAARADDVLSTDESGGSLVRLVPVRGTPFSVLVRVAFDEPLTAPASLGGGRR